MTKVAVILSGCGVYDGTEIHESVITLLALAREGADVTCAAPDITQRHVINHITGEEYEDEDRNVLEESARICRGKISNLGDLRAKDFDAVIFCGGFGAAKNLSTLAFDGIDYDADPGIVDFIQEAHENGSAQGFMCISPALAAIALGGKHIQLTVGNNESTATALEAKGAKHVACTVDNIVTDEENKIVTTPAYMLASNIIEAETGINKLVQKVLELASK